MKKLFFICCFWSSLLFGQTTQIWVKYDKVIGMNHGNITNWYPNSSLLMPEVIQFNSGYRMYYTMKNADSSQIRFADSPDGMNWTDGGTILKSDTSKSLSNKRWEINGPSVIKLNSGKYRMYYCASTYYKNSPPPFNIRSAISNDGTTFTDEGIRIDIYPNDANSTLSLAGHGSYIVNDSGSVTAIFSGNAKGQIMQPSNLFIARSTDGLTFTNIFSRYNGWHDPIIVKQNNKYIMYAMYMISKEGKTISDDGLAWPNPMDSISFQDSIGNCLSESVDGIGDIGGLTMPGNEIFLYTNFGAPSKDIALFKLFNPTVSIFEKQNQNINFKVYPNPLSDASKIEFEYSKNIIFTLTNLQGKIIYKKEFFNTSIIDLSELKDIGSAVYLFTVESEKQKISGKIIK